MRYKTGDELERGGQDLIGDMTQFGHLAWGKWDASMKLSLHARRRDDYFSDPPTLFFLRIALKNIATWLLERMFCGRFDD